MIEKLFKHGSVNTNMRTIFHYYFTLRAPFKHIFYIL